MGYRNLNSVLDKSMETIDVDYAAKFVKCQ